MITITEALAEVKTIEKRVTKKQDFVASHVLRQEMIKDPLAEQGGPHLHTPLRDGGVQPVCGPSKKRASGFLSHPRQR